LIIKVESVQKLQKTHSKESSYRRVIINNYQKAVRGN